MEAVTVLSERDESISLARAIGDDAAPKQGRQLGMSEETDGVRFTEQHTNRPVKFSYCLLIEKVLKDASTFRISRVNFCSLGQAP